MEREGGDEEREVMEREGVMERGRWREECDGEREVMERGR